MDFNFCVWKWVEIVFFLFVAFDNRTDYRYITHEHKHTQAPTIADVIMNISYK